jgi:hypothetical protein
MPEIGASGSVRGEGGNILTYSARCTRTPSTITKSEYQMIWQRALWQLLRRNES